MRDGYPAGLLRIVDKIPLSVQVGGIPDDLDAVFIGSHGSVGAHAVEFGPEYSCRGGVDALLHRERGEGNVVGDAYGKPVFRLFSLQVVKDRLDHGGGEFLGTQAVAAADDQRGLLFLHVGGANVLIERFTRCARFLGAVQHGQAPAGRRYRRQEMLGGEGAEEAHLDQAYFLSGPAQVIHRLLRRVATGPHAHDHPFRVGSSGVIKKMIPAAGHLEQPVHLCGYDVRRGPVEAVQGFPVLEENIRILGGASLVGTLRGKGPAAESGYRLPIHHLFDLIVVD